MSLTVRCFGSLAAGLLVNDSSGCVDKVHEGGVALHHYAFADE